MRHWEEAWHHSAGCKGGARGHKASLAHPAVGHVTKQYKGIIQCVKLAVVGATEILGALVKELQSIGEKPLCVVRIGKARHGPRLGCNIAWPLSMIRASFAIGFNNVDRVMT